MDTSLASIPIVLPSSRLSDSWLLCLQVVINGLILCYRPCPSRALHFLIYPCVGCVEKSDDVR